MASELGIRRANQFSKPHTATTRERISVSTRQRWQRWRAEQVESA